MSRLHPSEWELAGFAELAREHVNADRVRSVLLAFGSDDTRGIVDAIEDAIDGARARAVQSLAPIVTLSQFYATLWCAPVPLRCSMRALKRCCLIAWGGDEDIEHYRSTTN
jgi:hypothetical protein